MYPVRHGNGRSGAAPRLRRCRSGRPTSARRWCPARCRRASPPAPLPAARPAARHPARRFPPRSSSNPARCMCHPRLRSHRCAPDNPPFPKDRGSTARSARFRPSPSAGPSAPSRQGPIPSAASPSAAREYCFAETFSFLSLLSVSVLPLPKAGPLHLLTQNRAVLFRNSKKSYSIHPCACL